MQTAVVVSQNAEKRRVLGAVLEAAGSILRVVYAHGIEEALAMMESLARVDYIVVTRSFADSEIASLFAQAKDIRGAKESKHIVVLQPGESSKTALVNGMLAGAHAFIQEPISRSNVEEALVLAMSVKRSGSSARLRAAAGLMFSQVMDDSQPGRASRTEPKSIWEEVKHACAEFKKLTGQSMTMVVVKPLQELGSPKDLEEYHGVSQRVRQIYERRVKMLFQRLTWFTKKTR